MEIQLQQPLVSNLCSSNWKLWSSVPVKAIRIKLIAKYQNNKSRSSMFLCNFIVWLMIGVFTNDTIFLFHINFDIVVFKRNFKTSFFTLWRLNLSSIPNFFQNPQQIFHQFFSSGVSLDGFGFCSVFSGCHISVIH
jgi:hypothetical protein